MAGLFGFMNYSKEGPGVYPEKENKGPVRRFFSIFFRKFWKFCTLNLMYLLVNLPALVLSFFAASFVWRMSISSGNVQHLQEFLVSGGLSSEQAVQLIGMQNLFMILLIAAFYIASGFIGIGPFQAGMHFIFRNYAREDHAFIWSDFREHSGKNWKQGLIHCLITIAWSFLCPLAIHVYGLMFRGSIVSSILISLFVLFLLITYMMQFYIYQLMVTFDLPLRHIYRNALLLVLARLPMSLLVCLISLVLVVGIPFLVLWLGMNAFLPFYVIYFIFFAFAWNFFLQNYFANLQIQKFIFSRIEREKNDE